MRINTLSVAIAAAVAASGVVLPNAHAIEVYKDGDKFVDINGRIQAQYHQVEPNEGDSTDKLFFRRVRLGAEVGIKENWEGRVEFDFGDAEDDNEMSLKSNYITYTGFEGAKVMVGNAKFPFSRETLTSSRKLGTVERTFVGDHNYGVPEYVMGLHFKGKAADMVTWGAAVASSSIDPDTSRLDFDTPVNKKSDFNEGWVLGGRVEVHPMGEVKFDQGDFEHGDLKVSFGLGAFTWSNDDDNNTYTDNGVGTNGSKADVDAVTGYEVSAAMRGFGLSVDAQYNSFDAETVDSAVTSGIYQDGETTLESYAVKAGYMIVPSTFEAVVAYDALDADGYEEAWTRTSVGANWYFNKHATKVQLTYVMGSDVGGVKDEDQDELYLQASYYF